MTETARREPPGNCAAGSMTGMWTLLGPDGPYRSPQPGTLGGHRRSRIYGRLDCPSAEAALRRGTTYAANRVFFADEGAALACGYRPCARCLPDHYAAWRAGRPR